MIKIAVVGSRDFKNKEFVEAMIYRECNYPDVIVITGGARGVDMQAIDFAKKYRKQLLIIRPINPSNKFDYLFRNVEIITMADKIICFWDEESRGAKFVIDYAKARGKQINIYKEDGSEI